MRIRAFAKRGKSRISGVEIFTYPRTYSVTPSGRLGVGAAIVFHQGLMEFLSCALLGVRPACSSSGVAGRLRAY